MAIKKFTIVSACMNRSPMLRVSLQSWIGNPSVSEIIIVDWSSKDPLLWAKSLDPRVNILRINNQKFFNKGKALNTGIQASTGNFVIQMDVDYILNPYKNLVEVLQKTLTEEDFLVCSGWMGDGAGTGAPFLKPTNGFLCAPKKRLLEAGGYNENLQGWGYDDDDIIYKLKKLGLNQKILRLSGGKFIYHNPHGPEKRAENYANKNLRDSWERNKAISEKSLNNNA